MTQREKENIFAQRRNASPKTRYTSTGELQESNIVTLLQSIMWAILGGLPSIFLEAWRLSSVIALCTRTRSWVAGCGNSVLQYTVTDSKVTLIINQLQCSRGNMLTSRPNVRGFMHGWGQWIYSGRKKSWAQVLRERLVSCMSWVQDFQPH